MPVTACRRQLRGSDLAGYGREVRSLSGQARALIEALEAKRRFPSRLVRIDAASRAALFDELAGLGEVAAVPALVRFTLEPGERRAASRALRALLSNLTCDAHLDLERWVRDLGEWNTPLGRTALADVGALDDAGLLGLLTSHGSGYVREAALRKLVRVDLDFAWPFLLLRINDWVAPIRAWVLELALSQLPKLPHSTLVKYLPLVERLKHVRRAEPLALLRQVDAQLALPEGLAALEAGLASLPLRSRRAAYLRLLARTEVSAALLSRALAEQDPLISLEAAARAREVLESAELTQLLQRLERSRVATVRREAYLAYAIRFPSLAVSKLEAALSDPSKAVRDFARQRLPGWDFPAFYREAVTSSNPRPGALLGLGDVGTAEDVERLRPFFRDPRIRMACAALRAGSILAAQRIEPELREAFAGNSPAITRVAAMGLEALGPALDADWLGTWLQPGRSWHHVRHATRLVPGLNRWEGLALIVRCVGSPEPRVSDWARKSLGSWFMGYNRRFVSPQPTQLERIAALLPQVPLPSPFDRELPQLIATWKR